MRYTVQHQLVISAAHTVTLLSADMHAPRGGRLLIVGNVSAVSGTNPTMTIYAQVKSIAGTYLFVNQTGQITGTTAILLDVGVISDLWRINADIGGSSPSFTFELDAIWELVGPDAP